VSRAAPSRLVTSGLAELACGALSGWVYTVARTQPELARRLGIRSAERVHDLRRLLGIRGKGLAMSIRTALAAR
jgi:hypothetical protein